MTAEQRKHDIYITYRQGEKNIFGNFEKGIDKFFLTWYYVYNERKNKGRKRKIAAQVRRANTSKTRVRCVL